MIEKDNGKISLRQQCMLLTVNLSTLYYTEKPPANNTELANEIHEIWMKFPCYGSRKITAALGRLGYEINRKRVQRLMREMNLKAIYPEPKTSISDPKAGKYSYLLAGMIINHINQVWATDITYIKMPQGFVYLIAMIDVYSRKILAWKLSTTMETLFCLSMLRETLLNHGAPLILNTDQGSQFTSNEWIQEVLAAGTKVSQDGKGRWADNIYIERFWRTAKYEHIFLRVFETVQEARRSIGEYIILYNAERLHQNLGYNTPDEVFYGKVKGNPVEMWKTLTSLPTVPPDQQQPQEG